MMDRPLHWRPGVDSCSVLAVNSATNTETDKETHMNTSHSLVLTHQDGWASQAYWERARERDRERERERLERERDI